MNTPMPTRILIVGGGGFGLEMLGYLRAEQARNPAAPGVAILNDGADCQVLQRHPEVAYAGPIADYQPQPGDALTIAIGNAPARRRIAALLQARGAQWLTYVHPTAMVAATASLGAGAIVGPFCVVNASAVVEENAVVNMFCNIGHGARVGAHAVLSPYCALSGDSVLGAGSFMGTRATLFPKIVLGEDCVVDAHSAVRQSAPARKLITTRGQYLVLDQRATPTG